MDIEWKGETAYRKIERGRERAEKGGQGENRERKRGVGETWR